MDLNQIINPTDINRLAAEKTPAEKWAALLYEVAIGYLSRREYSRHELQVKLMAAYTTKEKKLNDMEPLLEGESLWVVNDVLSRLGKDNYQSDLRFAQMLLKTRANRSYGLFRIKMEMREKGVAEGVIRMALEHSGIDWFELSRDAYQKKFQGREIGDIRDKSKRVRFLQSRGFDQDQISYAIG